ncbi:MAG: ATP-binding cassette domain-containing protein [Methanobrevibacter sp.]|uniref:ABC transporter ATP-binding protein n=1 Tax=Methanobrevibacter sp. TaxID=66852 RepID=UPI0025FBA356|nr:ATP-binding cassette domain-containing protein [Methanobrevibacter sp.]MBQ6100540.1 ATP-binding cassette domain-containing protein [Methanobrevibacter sp.]MBQ6629913.1 ATP-binding cassette domain-containing protein [Methanobrevibacter sp.]
MQIITIKNFTKDYGNEKGVFDVSIGIEKGEVYGYLGPNGAGKSTTLRHLMGFSKPDSGTLSINNLDCWNDKTAIKKDIGYLPGEIALPEDMTGIAYLKLIDKLRKTNDLSYAEDLIEYFEIDTHMQIKKMSKGMKQKIAIIMALMHNPEILLLDEPTSGLDPLMQEKFIRLIKREKQNGKTIILSSHIFEEISKVCDRVGIIKRGKLIKEVVMKDFKHSENKTYKIEFKNENDFNKIRRAYPDADFKTKEMQIIISITDREINDLISNLSSCEVAFLKEEKHTLEEYFMKFYGDEEHV